METQQIVTRFLELPADAQRIVADLITYLDQHGTLVKTAVPAAVSAGATLLPPIDISAVPTTWPENSFANPEFFGAWAGRTDIADSTEFVQELRRKNWGAQR